MGIFPVTDEKRSSTEYCKAHKILSGAENACVLRAYSLSDG